MSYIDVAHLSYVLPDGRPLLDDVSFRVGDGAHVALVGANGAGKTTLLRLVAGDLEPTAGGVVTYGGRLGVMRQFIGSIATTRPCATCWSRSATPALRGRAARSTRPRLAMMERDDEKTPMRYAHALAAWGDAGGYDAEVLWDTCTVAALGEPFGRAGHRLVRTLSGGEQKRLALEALLRGDDEVLLLDEPDNYLDVAGQALAGERTLDDCRQDGAVRHPRPRAARQHGRPRSSPSRRTRRGCTAAASRRTTRRAQARLDRLDELHRRWDEEHQRLKDLVSTLRVQAKISPDMARRYRAMVTRLEKFEAAGPPPEQAERAEGRDAAAAAAVPACARSSSRTSS